MIHQPAAPTLDASPRLTALLPIARAGDRLMFATLFAQALVALAVGGHFDALGLAASVSAPLLVVGTAAYLAARGRLVGRTVLTVCHVAFVVLQIQLGRGTIEFHFGVFVLLAITLVYRDWRMLVLTAGLFAVHHVLFDRLQAFDVGVYCTPQADLLKTSMHALYVVGQTGIEILLAVQLERATVEAAELGTIVRRVDGDGVIGLDLTDLVLVSPTGRLLQAAIANIDSAMKSVHGAATSIELSAAEIAHGNLDLSHRTEQQASSLQQTAASMEQIVGTSRTSADAATRARDLAGSAATAARAGGQAVDQIVVTMNGISESSRRIADIVGVIDAIAFQTNLLALNAAVEAARAGEQGRGFAVVASEVRSLANRSASAAKEIKSLIGSAADQVQLGIDSVGSAGSAIGGLVDQVLLVSDIVSGISHASGEQTAGIDQIGRSVTELDAVTQQNSALVEEAAAASLRDQTVRLNAVVSRFALSGRRA